MKLLFFIVFISLLLNSSIIQAEEGMWPITEIDKIDLQSKGLTIPVNDIFNPGNISLMQAVIRLSGCTASFVSPDGLILTNHHCAFSAVQRASTAENDYLTKGFLAGDLSEELFAPGYTASIMESYTDVSSDVLSAVTEDMDLLERTEAIEKKKKELVLQAEKENPGKWAEISEMFIGKSYLLFLYTKLKDIRLVYVPPVAIGEFGGETDNWMWPRHTGDFSFLRAYVAPDGSPADYSEKNIPYKPRMHFQIAPEGVNEEDFVFIMGYPGITYRHRTSYFLAYEQNIRLPYLASEYEKAIHIMEDFSKKDTDTALKLASLIKSLSNRMKNYRGKLIGMKRINLLEKRRIEEKKLQEFYSVEDDRLHTLRNVLEEIEEVYREKSLNAQSELLIENIWRLCVPLKNAKTVFEAAENRSKPDVERETDYMDRNINRTKEKLLLGLKSYYPPSEKIILGGLLKQMIDFPEEQKIETLNDIIPDGNITMYINNLYKQTKFVDENFINDSFSLSSEELKALNDPAIKFILALNQRIQQNKDKSRAQSGTLNKLHPKLIEFKKEYYSENFIPDANSTFRLTFGYIRGYYPKDAIYCSPITSFQGVIQKTTGKEPFITPPSLLDLYQQKNFGQFFNQKLNDVPVAILYNTDTTGGNSGSPILNAMGQLVGINFDRVWEATINDYAWNESYSRSIGVDIRYVLWITQKFAGADYLLQEMNIPLE
jgi:hypothetical protein